MSNDNNETNINTNDEEAIVAKVFEEYEKRSEEEKENGNDETPDVFHLPLGKGMGMFGINMPNKDMSHLLFKRPTPEVSCDELSLFTEQGIATKKYQSENGAGYFIGDSIRFTSRLTNRVASKRFVKEVFQHWLMEHYRYLNEYMFLTSIIMYEEHDTIFFRVIMDDNECCEFSLNDVCPVDETLRMMSIYVRTQTDGYDDELEELQYD